MSPNSPPKAVLPSQGYLPAPPPSTQASNAMSTTYLLPRLQMPGLPGPPLTHPPRLLGSASVSPHPNPSATAFFDALPATAPPVIRDIPALAAAQLSVARLHAQKRAYRQRRKDPSCDACRERKVKCDATETTSCSECSGRNVRCQFTKETNRRMSSIKQVQELERQLSHARQQLYQLRTKSQAGTLESSTELPSQQGLGFQRKRRARPALSQDLSNVRRNLQRYGQGIIHPLDQRRQSNPYSLTTSAPALPPRELADELLRRFHASVHVVFPILDWSSFCHTYETVYESATLESVSPTWAALLFSVLACGSVYKFDDSDFGEQDGEAFLEASRSLIDPWEDNYDLDHARMALLCSIFLFESNLKSAAWTWLGTAVRISQNIGLNAEPSVPLLRADSEMRKRLWWSIYVWDRLLSLELGRPLQIDEDDSELDAPSPIDSRHAYDSGANSPMSAPPVSQSALYFNVEILRCVGAAAKARKSSISSMEPVTLSDAHFEACAATLSQQLDLYPMTDPRSAAPAISLQNARLVTHRHNLSPVNPPEIRRAALESCVAISRDTARFISRLPCSQPSAALDHDMMADWNTKRLGPIASALFCTHLWRCTLFLCFRGHFGEARRCARVLATIGDLRAVNVACGRHATFFLGTLLDWTQRHPGEDVGADEEMLAYVSGDLQCDRTNAWVWQQHDADDFSVAMDLTPVGSSSGAGATAATMGFYDRESPQRSSSSRFEETGVTFDRARILAPAASSSTSPAGRRLSPFAVSLSSSPSREPQLHQRQVAPPSSSSQQHQHQHQQRHDADTDEVRGSWEQVVKMLDGLLHDQDQDPARARELSPGALLPPPLSALATTSTATMATAMTTATTTAGMTAAASAAPHHHPRTSSSSRISIASII